MSRFREYHQSKGTKSGGSKGKGVELVNFDQIMLQVKNLGQSVKTNAMRAIIKENLKPVAAAIKAKTPIRDKKAYQGKIIRYTRTGKVSTTSTPGNLRRSIGIKTFANKRYGEVTGYAGIQNGKRIEGMEGGFNDGWYGFFRERGTKNQPARPFIKPAAATSVPTAKEHLAEDVRVYLVKNAKKLGLKAK